MIVRLQGGLGNQMFQYAIGRRVSHMNNTDLKLDLSFYKNKKPTDTPRQYSLDNFNIIENFSTKKDSQKIGIPDLSGRNLPARARRKIFRIIENKKPLYKKRYILEPYFGFNPDVLKIKDNAYLNGNWQNENYFKDISGIIKKEFTLKNGFGKNTKEVFEKIKGHESVSLHIRRGDYILNEKTNKYHGTCSLEYYQKAMNIISQKVTAPHFFVFSDDIDWAKENLKTHFPITFVSDEKIPDFEELMLMKECKHNIIANSSFSWWGAWLNDNPEKIVIAPKTWFLAEERKNDNPCPDAWIKI